MALDKERIAASVEELFRNQVRRDKNVKNAYVLLHSDRMDLHINLAEGATGSVPADPRQPNYMASVGKLCTSTIISILSEQNVLSFDDRISGHLDQELLEGLHVHKGTDHTNEIRIRHLLNQTSGLPDNFEPLMNILLADPDFSITPREAIEWVKKNSEPHFPPGTGFRYTDTNYHLLGLIIENRTGLAFHEALKQYIYEPLDMKQSSMLHNSEPMEQCAFPMADFCIRETRLNEVQAYGALDYAGGGVVAPLEDLLMFMKALVSHRLLSKDTLQTMMADRNRFTLGIDYGYGTWHLTPVPLLMPKRYASWGVAGVTGSFMFYHPAMDTYFIGSFNDSSYKRKFLRFMGRAMDQLRKGE
jgi:D-alanyl-D-alanine carboxypeptidase